MRFPGARPAPFSVLRRAACGSVTGGGTTDGRARHRHVRGGVQPDPGDRREPPDRRERQGRLHRRQERPADRRSRRDARTSTPPRSPRSPPATSPRPAASRSSSARTSSRSSSTRASATTSTSRSSRNRVILVVIFDERSSLGLVRLRVKKAADELNDIFERHPEEGRAERAAAGAAFERPSPRSPTTTSTTCSASRARSSDDVHQLRVARDQLQDRLLRPRPVRQDDEPAVHLRQDEPRRRRAR